MKRIEIKVDRLTSWELAADCARATVWKNALGREPSEKFKADLVRCEHSPLRTIIYKVEMHGIPSFVSVHFVRHKFGVEHFVSSNRADRNGGKTGITRWTPVNHIMVVNAQELLFMARRRLCNKASRETRWVMKLIRREVTKIDSVVGDEMIPMCVYRGGVCPEIVPCYEDGIK